MKTRKPDKKQERSPSAKTLTRGLLMGTLSLIACVPEPMLSVNTATNPDKPAPRTRATSTGTKDAAATPPPSERVAVIGVVRAPAEITPAGAVNMAALGSLKLAPRRYALDTLTRHLFNLEVRPLASAFVQAFELTNRPVSNATLTDSEGAYRIPGLPRGEGPYLLKTAVNAGSVGPFALETLARPGEVLFHDIDIATTLVTAALIQSYGTNLSGVTAEKFERTVTLIRRQVTRDVLPLLSEPERLASFALDLAAEDPDVEDALNGMQPPTPTPASTERPSTAPGFSPNPVAFPTPRPTLTPWPPISPGSFFGVVGLQRITPFSGGTSSGFADGSAPNARFQGVEGLAFDATGQLYAADRLNHAIRRIDSLGQVTTLAGDREPGPAIVEARGVDARFREPSEVAVIDLNTLVIADTGNHQIRWLTHTDGEQVKVTVLCGDGLPGYEEGFQRFVRLDTPVAMAYDGVDTLFVADVRSAGTAARILTVDLRDRNLTASAPPFTRRFGYTQTYAGGEGKGVVNGPASSARFIHPAGLAVRWVGGPAGAPGSTRELWIADREAGNIRRIVDNFSSEPVVSTVIGPTESVAEGPFGWRDTLPLSNARFNRPNRLAFSPSGDLFIADTGNAKIRWVRFASGSPAEISSLKPAFVSAGGQSEPFELPGVTGLAIQPISRQIFLGQPTPGRLHKME